MAVQVGRAVSSLIAGISRQDPGRTQRQNRPFRVCHLRRIAKPVMEVTPLPSTPLTSRPMNSLFEQFVILWVVIDPIGTIPVFVAVTAGMPSAALRKTAIQAALVATLVLGFFLVLGQFLIDALGISLPAFQIAGGVILFLFALTMIFGLNSGSNGVEQERGDGMPAIFPLAVPSLASPGAILAIVLLTDNNRFSIPEQAVTAAIMVSVMIIALLFMLTAGPILRVIRKSGAAIVSRVMGMVLAAVAVDNVIEAIFQLVAEGPSAPL